MVGERLCSSLESQIEGQFAPTLRLFSMVLPGHSQKKISGSPQTMPCAGLRERAAATMRGAQKPAHTLFLTSIMKQKAYTAGGNTKTLSPLEHRKKPIVVKGDKHKITLFSCKRDRIICRDRDTVGGRGGALRKSYSLPTAPSPNPRESVPT